jgi:hypothetical protein
MEQGCQMVCFQTKNPNLGKFWRVLQWKILVYFKTVWSILLSFEIFYGHLVYFMYVWSFGIFFPDLVFGTKNNLATLPWGTVAGKVGGQKKTWMVSDAAALFAPNQLKVGVETVSSCGGHCVNTWFNQSSAKTGCSAFKYVLVHTHYFIYHGPKFLFVFT